MVTIPSIRNMPYYCILSIDLCFRAIRVIALSYHYQAPLGFLSILLRSIITD
ncbi:Bgt-50868 [Blumeria graminis f. sp. tritici]|uniref:Bgt-50868 n=1 Tax=Blumeria graminis f. sp. tritici TaxID=62690 RepID=A0A9X9L9A5_BLUGR|nr:Bgt-50868 [Blumeria graminis f. sp. tritici]